jgi:NADH-quinone oxidoreductase subunit C
MEINKIIDQLKSIFPDIKTLVKFGNQIEIRVTKKDVTALLHYLRNGEFQHLSNMMCIDWPDDNQMDVVYNVWSYTYKVHLYVKLAINREKTEAPTIHTIWPQAGVYEREIHEMFGVKFVGNPNLAPMFLHNWQDIPPLRKDFDTLQYAKKAYEYDRYD